MDYLTPSNRHTVSTVALQEIGWDGAQDSPWSLSLLGQETATPPPKLEPVAKEEKDEAMASTGEKDRVP